jgi:hypothetical protein
MIHTGLDLAGSSTMRFIDRSWRVGLAVSLCCIGACTNDVREGPPAPDDESSQGATDENAEPRADAPVAATDIGTRMLDPGPRPTPIPP